MVRAEPTGHPDRQPIHHAPAPDSSTTARNRSSCSGSNSSDRAATVSTARSTTVDRQRSFANSRAGFCASLMRTPYLYRQANVTVQTPQPSAVSADAATGYPTPCQRRTTSPTRLRTRPTPPHMCGPDPGSPPRPGQTPPAPPPPWRQPVAAPPATYSPRQPPLRRDQLTQRPSRRHRRRPMPLTRHPRQPQRQTPHQRIRLRELRRRRLHQTRHIVNRRHPQPGQATRPAHRVIPHRMQPLPASPNRRAISHLPSLTRDGGFTLRSVAVSLAGQEADPSQSAIDQDHLASVAFADETVAAVDAGLVDVLVAVVVALLAGRPCHGPAACAARAIAEVY